MKNVLLHLRIPFSFFLMPVYWFALSQSNLSHRGIAVGIFILLHLFIYPASNAYNSYYDKDESSIGGLENPPPVSESLFYTAWILDIMAIVVAWAISGWILALALLIYSSVSKAYSNERIRLKKYPIISWLTVGIFQGAFTYLAIIQAVDNIALSSLWQWKYLFPALLSSCNLLGFYPMTQVYQHKEDAKRGDLTISRLLGIRGTFLFTGFIFLVVTIGFFLYFQKNELFGIPVMALYLVIMSPVLLFFNGWFLKILKNEDEANFKNTMKLNLIGSFCLNTFFILLFLKFFF